MDLKSRDYITFLIVGFAIVIASCLNVTDYEATPLEQVNIDKVFEKDDSLGVEAKNFLLSVYRTIYFMPEINIAGGHNRLRDPSGLVNHGDYLDSASDDAVSTTVGLSPAERLFTGAYSATNIVEPEMRWRHFYANIRKANIFITNIDDVPLKETFTNVHGSSMSVVDAWKSEARFIRVWNYFELLRSYGGVPIVGDAVPQLGDDLNLPRNTFEEVVDYILSECDAIQDSIRSHPVENPTENAHVVTREAVLALKARVLLFAASPLFNGENIDPQNPLTGYTNYSAERWWQAADAARQIIQEGKYFLMDDFSDIFTTINTGTNNPEVIFWRAMTEHTQHLIANGPVGLPVQTEGSTSPTQNLVDAFPMANGLPIDALGSGYDPANPYENRDPRFYETILYNGSRWVSRTLDMSIEGRNRPGGTERQTRTGYYLRKFMGDFEEEPQFSNSVRDWSIFRYAEILLNFAEAENEYTGPTSEVYEAVELIRERAGLNPYQLDSGLSQDEMRELIRNERRVELAFEEHRYWDIRRWKIADQIYSEPLRGVRIISRGPEFEYIPEDILSASWEERRYLYPIPYEEVVGNSQMQQNPQW